MKVLLISGNSLTAPYPVYPLGIDYVAGALMPAHEVQIVDLNTTPDYKLLKDQLRAWSPDVIGISIRNIDNTESHNPQGFIEAYRQLIRQLRADSQALIVLGGCGFSIFPQELFSLLEADFGIIGEGERLRALLDALEQGKDVSGMGGVVTSKTDAITKREVWERRFPRHFSKQHPHLGYYLKNGGMLNLQTKRGCPFKCIYCTYPHIEGRELRLMEPDAVARIARELQDAGAKYFFITDSAFNADYQHSLDIARAFIRIGVSIPWGAFLTPVRLTTEYFRQMADAGLQHAEFGTESMSDRMLSAYRKPFKSAHVLKTHEAALEAGLHVAHYFLLGGPGECRETLEETFSNLEKLERTVCFFFCGMRIYPGTELYAIALKEGRISTTQDLLKPTFYESAQIETAEIYRMLEAQAVNRTNWIIGSGGEKSVRIISKMYKYGYSGPLWEYLIQ